MRFKTGQALRSAMMKISWISNFSKDDFVKKGLPLSIKRKLSILLNFPFPPVSFSGVFFTLKCETGFVNPPHELSHFWGFLSRGAFFMENPKTDLWSQIIRILHYRKTENPKKDHLPWQRHVLVLLVKKKKQQQQQTDPHGEGKKKSTISHEWIYEMFIFRFQTETFLE